MADKADWKEAVQTLIEVLETDCDFLYRYHTAAALISITGISGFQPVDLGGTHIEVTRNIERFKSILITGTS